MSPTEIAAAFAILCGAIAGLLTATGTFSADRRKARREKYQGDTDNAAVLLASWKALGDSISSEVERVRKACTEEIAKLKAEHEQDRREWQVEKLAMQEEIETLKAQVYSLLQTAHRPPTRRTRSTDKER